MHREHGALSAGPQFRSQQTGPEARMWMIEGIAGGIQPWWHMVGAWHEDRRMYNTPEPRLPVAQSSTSNTSSNRKPVAAVGVVWSQRNTDFFGRDNAADLVDAPYRGFTEALLHARIPYLPVNADDDLSGFGVLILPNVGALSDQQCAAIRSFAQRGGAVIASGATSLYNEWGDARKDFALADLFGAHAPSAPPPAGGNSYLRLVPDMRGKDAANRHPVLRGFEETNIIPFGGGLAPVRTDPGAVVPLTFVPAFPSFPPETAWMRQPITDIPGLVLNGRNAYFAADLDRRYARNNLPDHANLLANVVRWAAGDRIGLEVRGPGLIDCFVYRQTGRLVVHLVNLTNEGTWRGPLDELISVGPHEVHIKLPEDVRGRGVQCLVSNAKPSVSVKQGWATFELKSILDHEVAVVQ